MMSGGGRVFGEMMMLCVSVGSWGLRDQMAHFAVPGLEVGWVDSCAVDMSIPRWGLLIIRQPGSLLSVVRHRCQYLVKCQ